MARARTAEVIRSGLNAWRCAASKHVSRQYVPAAMRGMYRSGAFTSWRGGRYLCPPEICAAAGRIWYSCTRSLPTRKSESAAEVRILPTYHALHQE